VKDAMAEQGAERAKDGSRPYEVQDVAPAQEEAQAQEEGHEEDIEVLDGARVCSHLQSRAKKSRFEFPHYFPCNEIEKKSFPFI
jgi:hypothetical protein